MVIITKKVAKGSYNEKHQNKALHTSGLTNKPTSRTKPIVTEELEDMFEDLRHARKFSE